MTSGVEEILRRCREGDEAAWASLVDRYASLVFAVARSHGLPEDSCEDVAQTVFTALVRSLGSIREPEALPGWLVTSTRRACWRLNKRVEPDGRGRPEPVEPDLLERRERRAAVLWAVREVGPPCTDLLTALFLRDAEPGYKRIADELEMPIGSIGPTRARCLAKMAKLLADKPFEPR